MKDAAERRVGALMAALKASAERFSEASASRLAAAISYYALFSLLPLLLVLGALAEQALGDSEALRERLLRWTTGMGSSAMHDVFAQTLDDMGRRAPNPAAGIGLGLFFALLGASGVFIGLDEALKLIFRVPATQLSVLGWVRQLVRERLSAFLVVLGTSMALLLTTVARGALELPAWVPGSGLVGSAASLVLGGCALTGGITLCYRLMPGSPVLWRSAWQGALVASFALHLLREPFAWFVVHLTTYAAYGLIGAVLGILTWFQVAACVLLFGACVTATLGESQRRKGSVGASSVSTGGSSL